jgi:hypothetical protein
MAVIKYRCPICDKVTGAKDTVTGEQEYIQAVRWWEDKLYCRECYNEYVLEKTAFMGGIDGVDIIED